MMHTDSIRYLEKAGFHYKSAESPDLWDFLESHFAGPRPIGPKFVPMPSNFIAELISMGEEAILEAMVTHHRKTGTPGRVVRVLDLPYVVGTAAMIPAAKADKKRVLCLIDQPGTAKERVINVQPASPDDIPCTSQVTVTGGVYADGHTAGYFDLLPGEWEDADSPKGAKRWVYLVTPDEIATLVGEMEARIDDITVLRSGECRELLKKAKASLQ